MIKSLVVFFLLLSACTQQVHEDKILSEATIFLEQLEEDNLSATQLLKDTTITVLWRESLFDSISNNTFSTLVLNDGYFKTISDPERAALGYVSLSVGSECDWDGEANDDRSNLNCKVTHALGLGYQCSDKHLSFLNHWFRDNPEALANLKNCSAVPFTATAQNTFNHIALTTKADMIKVNFEASGINMREAAFWEWSEELVFKVYSNKLELVSQRVTTKNKQ